MGEMSGPSVFLTGLSSRSVHTIYAGSFVVYLFNILADCCHTYNAVKGYTITFPLKPWVVYLMMSCCSIGAVLNFLLLHLCCENALWHRWTIEPYEGGCRLICNKLYYWLTDFDCFRISFLIMIFEDAPMSVVNYWLISSCSIPHLEKQAWPFYLSCGTTTVSLCWRAIIVFLVYRRVRFLEVSPSPSHHNYHGKHENLSASSTLDDIKNTLGMTNNGNIVNQCDECWPVRASVYIAYQKNKNGSDTYLPVIRAPDNVFGVCYQTLCCCFLCHSLYVLSFLIGCLPCCYHYTCREGSAHHRHKFAKTCTRFCATTFNAAMLGLSVLTLIFCLVLNILWMSSVHLLGNDHSVPEINEICITVDANAGIIQLGITPSNQRYSQVGDDINATALECKPLFDERGWGFWWERKKPTPWIYVKHSEKSTLAVWTDVIVALDAGIDRHVTTITYDVAHRDELGCYHNFDTNEWRVTKKVSALPWPYWIACNCKVRLEHRKVLMCNVTL